MEHREGRRMLEVRGVNGTVTFDGQTITIARTGFMARATIGKGSKSIPIQSVAAVQFKPAGLVRGFIQFTVPGGNEGRSRFGKQSVDAAKDENSVLFGRTQQAPFERLRDAVQAAISARSAPPPPAPPPPPPGQPQGVSVAEELGKLAELHHQGVLSQAEFEAAKARLLT